jgi:hypothetical protein
MDLLYEVGKYEILDIAPYTRVIVKDSSVEDGVYSKYMSHPWLGKPVELLELCISVDIINLSHVLPVEVQNHTYTSSICTQWTPEYRSHYVTSWCHSCAAPMRAIMPTYRHIPCIIDIYQYIPISGDTMVARTLCIIIERANSWCVNVEQHNYRPLGGAMNWQ